MTKTGRSIVLKTGAIGDSIDNLHLSIRNMNCLRNDSIETIEQLDAISDPALLKIPNMGLPSLKALRAEVDRYLNRDPKRDFRRELPGDPAFSRAWKAVEEMGGAAATASKARADWRCLLGHPMQGPKGVAHILVALEFFELIKCSDVLGKNDRQWIEIATVRTKFPQLAPTGLASR